jgi:hypothetical protein
MAGMVNALRKALPAASPSAGGAALAGWQRAV